MTQDEMVELAKQANFVWLTPDVRTLILLAVAKEREDVIQHLLELKVLSEDGAFIAEIRARGKA